MFVLRNYLAVKGNPRKHVSLIMRPIIYFSSLYMTQYFALDGVACLGKTSMLRQLKDLGLKVNLGDFAEHQEEDHRLLEKKNDTFIDLAYQSFLFGKVIDGGIHDRCPITNTLFCLIFRHINNTNFNEDAKCNIISELNWFCEKLLQTDFRNLQEIIYVHVQNFVFRYFAAQMKFPIVKVETVTLEDVLPALIPFISKASYINAPLKSKEYDAGIDLSTDNKFQILPYSKKVITFAE
ncbi:hypothetical protein ABEB36_000003 [Hypothenemus hampei]|uniref:Deoxynucleoside kinase domain-containing protein n=1 Tax=Hypothenemus hampei TaxID=57062 RepID=A0ABD1F9X7_HYPHA